MLTNVLNRIVAPPLRNASTRPVLIDASRKEISVEMGMRSTRILDSVKVLDNLVSFLLFYSNNLDIDECKTGMPCGNNICINVPGSFKCRCNAGYEFNDIVRFFLTTTLLQNTRYL